MTDCAKYEVLVNAECDICPGLHAIVYQFEITNAQTYAREKCSVCDECMKIIQNMFGDEYESV